MKTQKLAMFAIIGVLAVVLVAVGIGKLRGTGDAPTTSISDRFKVPPAQRSAEQTLHKPIILQPIPENQAPLDVSPADSIGGFDGYISDQQSDALVAEPREFLPLPIATQPE